MQIKNKIKQTAGKKKAKQEARIRELCREYKTKNPNASDKATLYYAFSYVYGKKGPSVVNKLLKDKETYQEVKQDIDSINEELNLSSDTTDDAADATPQAENHKKGDEI